MSTITSPKAPLSAALAGFIKFIGFALVIVLIVFMVFKNVNKQFDAFKADLRAQGQLKEQVQTLSDATDKLNHEIKLLGESQATTQLTLAELQKSKTEIVNNAKARNNAVQKTIAQLKADTALSPLSREQAISKVYAQALHENQCRLLPALCSAAQAKALAKADKESTK